MDYESVKQLSVPFAQASVIGIVARDTPKYRGIEMCKVAADGRDVTLVPAFDAEYYFMQTGEPVTEQELALLRDRPSVVFTSLPKLGSVDARDDFAGHSAFTYTKTPELIGEDRFVAKVSFGSKVIFVHYLVRAFDGMDRFAKESCVGDEIKQVLGWSALIPGAASQHDTLASIASEAVARRAKAGSATTARWGCHGSRNSFRL